MEPASEIISQPADEPTCWYSIRAHAAEDMPAVHECWLGTWKTARSAGCIPNDLFDEVTTKAIAQLMARGMKVDIICPANRPGQMMGWIAYEADPKSTGKSIVHYMFVKTPFRRRGLAKTMLAHVGNADGRFVYTHETGFMKYWPAAYHNPGVSRRKTLEMK